jgi:putative FmdB family regulatory protein
MPMYEYRCQDCNTLFEQLTFNSETEVHCTQCQSTRVEKELSVFAVGGTRQAAFSEAGPCGACGAAEQGMCRNN